MISVHQDHISEVAKACRILREEVLPLIDVIDLDDATYKDNIDQAGIDEVQSFLDKELTVTEKDDAIYILKLVRTALKDTNWVSFMKLARL